MDRITWDQTHLMLCYTLAMRSPDPSTKLGSVIVAPDNRIIACGYNGWPRGVNPFTDDDDPRWERPEKYLWMAHAERNALDNALRAGISVMGGRLYCPILPCIECARGIVQSGIKEVVYHLQAQEHFEKNTKPGQEWFKCLATTKRMFEEAGVSLRSMTDRIPRFESFICGSTFDPHVRHRSTIQGFATAEVVKPSK